MKDPVVIAYAFLVALAVAAHFAFLGYLVAGGFLAWWWPRALWLHAMAVGWGTASITIGLPCPLTSLERWARAGAGMTPLPREGFIAQYLTGVLYPAHLGVAVQTAVFTLVLVSWIGAARRLADRRAAPGSAQRAER